MLFRSFQHDFTLKYFSVKVCNQALGTFKFCRNFKFCRLLAEIADCKKSFLIQLSCICENLIILTAKRFKLTVHNNIFLLAKSDQFLIIMENGIQIIQLTGCIDFFTVWIYFNPRLPICKTCFFMRSVIIVSALLGNTFPDG